MDFYENRWRVYRRVFVIDGYQFVGTKYMKKSDGSFLWTGGVPLDPTSPIRAAAELRISSSGQKRLDVFPPNGATITVMASRSGKKMVNSMNDIDLTPTEEMAANAKRGLELRRKHGRGGTAVGVARARDISNRKTLSPETVRRMHAFFSRHEKNKAGGEDDAGYIAWMLWSGDAGQGWAKRKVEQMDKSKNQRSETYKAIAERLGSAATNDRPGAKATMGRMLHLHEVDELEEFLDAYGVKDYDIIKSIGQVKVPKSQVGKALDAIASLNREIRKEGIGGSVAVDVVPFSRPGAKARFASNDRARIQQELRRLLTTARAQGGANGREAARLANMYLSEISNPKVSDEDLDDANSATYMIAEVLKGNYSRPGAKAKMGANVRRGVDPKKGGQWITGTWDGGTWSAMVFSEPSEAYGIPEFPHISKLAINPKDKPGIGGVIVNYDRGWDIKPTTPELQKAYREIAQVATAEVNKAVKQGWYARPGAKAKMALDMSVLSGAKSLEVFIKDLMGAINVGNAREAIAVCEDISKKANDVKQRIRDTSKFSRPGAKVTNAVREGSKISAEDEACLKVMSAADEKVSDKIRTLIAEGKPQKQAVAIALDLKRREEL